MNLYKASSSEEEEAEEAPSSEGLQSLMSAHGPSTAADGNNDILSMATHGDGLDDFESN